MKRLVAITIVLCAAATAPGRSVPAGPGAHPAVVRVIAPERGGVSYGSGALVGVNEAYGLVVTNWHVVSDAAGPVTVVFPDGFRSPATVLKTDRDWDLAALAIRRPDVQPIRLAAEAPRPGERLTIAGYGRGWYRAATGRCTQYVSPGRNFPFEMVELAVPARQGDSGGPILNSRGQLAGVLFGAGFGRTMGSYCGRVQRFLASVEDPSQQSPTGPATPARPSMIAQRPRRQAAPANRPFEPDPPPAVAIGDVRPVPAWKAPADEAPVRQDLARRPTPASQETPVAAVAAQPPPVATPAEARGPTRAEQIKTILAGIGVLALLFHGLRLIGAVQGSLGSD